MSAPYPVLYSFRRCPYAMRARLALLASGQVCELREVVLAKKPAALLLASAKATVPVLITLEGQVLAQSLEVMHWALQQQDPQHWLPATEALQAEAQQLLAQCDGGFKFHLDRYKYAHRYALTDGLAHRAGGVNFLAGLNQRLGAHSHLLGQQIGLTDQAIAPFVRQFAHTDPLWFAEQPWPALQTWLSDFENSSAFVQVMKKYPPWQPEQDPIFFPAL
jgi:glutathione S-transferase